MPYKFAIIKHKTIGIAVMMLKHLKLQYILSAHEMRARVCVPNAQERPVACRPFCVVGRYNISLKI